MISPLFADGLFDWNEAIVRIAVLIVIPIMLALIGYVLYIVFKERNK
jgi:hypothetical protein